MVFDPFAGTGTTLVVSKQLQRNTIGVEIDPINVTFIKNRLLQGRHSDNIIKYRKDYLFTKNLDDIWPLKSNEAKKTECTMGKSTGAGLAI